MAHFRIVKKNAISSNKISNPVPLQNFPFRNVFEQGILELGPVNNNRALHALLLLFS